MFPSTPFLAITRYGEKERQRAFWSFGWPLNFEGQLYGQESNYTTWKLARMNLAIRDFSLSASNGERVGVRCRFLRNADSFPTDLHPDLKADFILAKAWCNPEIVRGKRGPFTPMLVLLLSIP